MFKEELVKRGMNRLFILMLGRVGDVGIDVGGIVDVLEGDFVSFFFIDVSFLV